ncbi:MAG: hypothetical protein L3J69_02990 [Desulfobacula sp.]|nr:hypothetical protein [Desulfobacula sp.]
MAKKLLLPIICLFTLKIISQYFQGGLNLKNRTKSYPKILEMIRRLREKYPKASKLYDIEVVPESGTHKNIKATAILWNKRDKYKEINKFDGCYVLRTDRLDLSDKEIWETYIMLTRIEGAFRSMKSYLGLRPIFHQNEKSANAHLLISVLAYHILHSIEYKLLLGLKENPLPRNLYDSNT